MGVYQGRVTSVDDPKQMDRAQVQVPTKFGTEILDWARPILIAPGWSWKPVVDDLVWVMFENGDPDRPLYFGSWWPQDANAASTLSDDAKTNYPVTRILTTPAGHKMVFDDTEDAEKITLQSKSGHKVELDDANGSEVVTISHKDGTSKIEIDSTGKVTIEANGNVEVTSPSDILLNGGGLTASGKVVTTLHTCAFTGAPHPAGSANVKATL
jgi:uncharacterized protein involved in type VI secretion and phage assembly